MNMSCRVCLNKTGEISLFDKIDKVQYGVKIMRCVNVTIVEDDGFPSLICRGCLNELSIAYEFVLKCEASDSELRRRASTTPAELYADVNSPLKVEIKQEHEIFDDVNYEDFLLDNSNEYSSKHNYTSQKHYKKCKIRKKLRRDKMRPIQCVVCGLMVKSPSAMEVHMRTHTGERPFQCQACEGCSQTKGALKRHTETFHTSRERKFTCETCGKSFFRKHDIITHIRIHTNESPFRCPFCPKSFKQVASLIRHKRTHTGDKPYSCQLCGKKFADKCLVSKHMSVHSDEKKFTCHLCSKSMKSKTALNAHLNLHSNSHEKQNICSYCGTAFNFKGNLNTHIRRVHSEKSGECNICLKTFSDMEAHMRVHTGEKPFVCNMCNSAFAYKRGLSHHMVFKHENASKYKCSIGECSKSFPTAMMLEFHLLKQHTNHTPYVCQHCTRGFFRVSDLSRHLRVSHMDLHTNQLKPVP